jgi:uncharacterized repeat protein (TIGR03803 family)
MTNARLSRIWLPVLMVILMLMSGPSALAEWKEKVLYSFQGGNDGQSPAGGVVFDKAGNLYGATYEGGSTCPSPGCGTIFQLSPGNGGTWTETILYEFNGKQGSYPEGGVIADANGNLYGTTAYGGSGICLLFGGNVGCGVVYELSPSAKKGGQWTYTVLYSFKGGKDGQIPQGDLTLDKAGNLYGATLYGGGYGSCNAPYFQHCGTVFKLSVPKQKGGKWTEKVLYGFKSVKSGQQSGDGANPNGGLVLDDTGAIYGTTYFGGNNQAGVCEGGSGGTGCGIAFELKPPSMKGGAWTEHALHRFGLGRDGSNPAAGVVFAKNGDLYGTTYFGPTEGYGTAFVIAKPSGKSHSWAEGVLYRFSNGGDGSYPDAGVTVDAEGYLYGTNLGGTADRGVVFRLKPTSQGDGVWEDTTIYTLPGPPNGWHPTASLIVDSLGALYGTTQWGGAGQSCQGGCGTVFEVWP